MLVPVVSSTLNATYLYDVTDAIFNVASGGLCCLLPNFTFPDSVTVRRATAMATINACKKFSEL